MNKTLYVCIKHLKKCFSFKRVRRKNRYKNEKHIQMKKYLNSKEEIIMKILWDLQKAFLKEIMEEYPKPKPPSTTIASIVKKLEEKGFVRHKVIGKTNQYIPVLQQEEYAKSEIKSLVQNYFSGSFEELVSFFYKDEKVDVEELNKIYKEIKDKEK